MVGVLTKPGRISGPKLSKLWSRTLKTREWRISAGWAKREMILVYSSKLSRGEPDDDLYGDEVGLLHPKPDIPSGNAPIVYEFPNLVQRSCF